MKLFKKVAMPLVIVSLCLWAIYVRFAQQTTEPEVTENLALASAVNSCDGITERAAKDLVAVVEFQKLEIAGRKARVFKMCMRDHGFVVNPEWVTYSTPSAKKLAQETSVSTDAAIEQLSRTDMMLAAGEGSRPSYWVSR